MEKRMILAKNSLPIIFRDIHEDYLSIEKADNKQWNFASKLKNFDKRYKSTLKKDFLK